MISYAQNFEDVILWRAFRDRGTGTYIDVGAMDPEFHSVTRHFYDSGWTGINIEPNPAFFSRLVQHRPNDINLPCGIGQARGVFPFVAFRSEGLSSFDLTTSSNFPGYESSIIHVPVVPLRDIACLLPNEPQFLKIDVEGWEAQVLKSADFSVWRPEVIVIESVRSTDHQPAWSQWEQILTESNYLFAYYDGLNRFYVRSESSSLQEHFELPPNVFDEFHIAEVVTLRERLFRIETNQEPSVAEPVQSATEWTQFSDQMETLQQHMTEIIEANAQLRRQVEDFATASDEKKKLQEQYRTIWTELLAERESRNEIQRRNEQLEAELSRFREENTRLSEASQRVMEESAKLQSDRADDQVWIGRLSQQCVALQSQIAGTAEQIRNFQNTVDWYEKHVRRLTEVLQYHGIKL